MSLFLAAPHYILFFSNVGVIWIATPSLEFEYK